MAMFANSKRISFDRLVDGELSPEEYRPFVASLDEQPDAWRQCAIAFLEAQALGSELKAMRSSADVRTATADKSASRPLATRVSVRNTALFIVIAATMLLAFALGAWTTPLFRKSTQDQQLVGNFTDQSSGRNEMPTQVGVPHATWRPVGNVQLVLEGDPSQTGRVPVYEVESASDEALDELLASQRPAIGADVMQVLKQHGFNVEHEKQYLPTPLDDGRQMIVPVDGYRITPVGRTY
jgi:hypothetical protein